MSFKRKFISAITLALATVAFTTFVAAQDTNRQDDSMQQQEKSERRGSKRGFGKKAMRGGKHDGGDRMLMRSFGQLNLSDAQKEQTRGIFENFKTSTETRREEMRGLAMKKRDGIITTEESARFKEIKTQLKTSGEQMRNSVLAILTAEQRTQLDQIKEDMNQKRMERRQNRQKQQSPTVQDN